MERASESVCDGLESADIVKNEQSKNCICGCEQSPKESSPCSNNLHLCSKSAISSGKIESHNDANNCDTNLSTPQAAGACNDDCSHAQIAEDILEDLNVCPLEDDIECLRVARIALMECYNTLHLLGPWCCGRVAETLAKQVCHMKNNSDGAHCLVRNVVTYSSKYLSVQVVSYRTHQHVMIDR